MLRLGLIENLQRVTTRPDHRPARSRPGGRVGGAFAGHGGEESLSPRRRGGGHGAVRSPVVQFVRGGILPAPVAPKPGRCIWRAAGSSSGSLEQGLSIEQLVHLESQNQAADQVSVSHSITSLRFLRRHGLEGVCRDPEPGRADFAPATRPAFTGRWIFSPATATAIRSSSSPGTASSRKRRWRKRPSNWPKTVPRQRGREDRTAHVGFYLIDKGRPLLERAANVRLALANNHRTKHPPFSAGLLCGRDLFAHARWPRSGLCGRPRRSKCRAGS